MGPRLAGASLLTDAGKEKEHCKEESRCGLHSVVEVCSLNKNVAQSLGATF